MKKQIIEDMGLFEIYCVDNEQFVDTLLVFGTPSTI